MPFASLPTEIVLLISSFLDPPSLARCSQVCRQWRPNDKLWSQIAIQRAYSLDHDGFESQEAFREISPASSHCLLQPLPDETHAQLSYRYNDKVHGNAAGEMWEPIYRGDPSGYFVSIGGGSSQELCKKKWCIDREWQCGPGSKLSPNMSTLIAAPPFVGEGWENQLDAHEEVGRDAWRIKIDHTDRVMISTGQRGGVRVVDLNTGQVLWRIPRNLTRHFPHVEYDRRCLIFDRIGQGRLDVWRQHRLNDPDSEEDQAIGTFTFYTSLPSDRPTRAFRFQYPVLAVATQDGYVLLWDIETQKITQEMTLAGSMHIDGNINYVDFDDCFVFIVGTGAKSVTVLSRKLGKVIWTLTDHFEAGLPSPSTFTIASESEDERSAFASLERRRLRIATPSPWEMASGRQNFAQLMMAPIQRWSAVHPDFRSRTLVILSQTNVLVLRDYLTYFLAWEKRREAEAKGDTIVIDSKALSLGLFADLRFGEDTPLPSDLSTSQLAVADSRAMCIVGKPMLLDLDPLRMTRNDTRNIGLPTLSSDKEVGDFVSDAEAGFAVYDTINPSDHDLQTDEAQTASLESCSCVAIDGTAIYAVQMQQDMQSGHHVHDVLIWDFAKAAKERW